MLQRAIPYFLTLLSVFVMAFGVGYWLWRMPPPESATIISSETVLFDTGRETDAIPALFEPTFESVLAADQYLADEGKGISLSLNGRERFYSFQILVWHEIVNDAFGTKAVVVTHDPLTAASAVYERSSVQTFAWSGDVWNNNLVMEEREGQTLWLQISGQSLADAGKQLVRLPAEVMSWKAWKRAHGKGEVLSRTTGFERDYTRNPYAEYAKSPAIWFPLPNADERLHLKEPVLGLST